MSDAKVCDNCGDKLLLDKRGEDENGEIAGWLRIEVAGEEWDACTRACAGELLADEGPVKPVIDDWSETVTGIARTLRGEDDEEPTP